MLQIKQPTHLYCDVSYNPRFYFCCCIYPKLFALDIQDKDHYVCVDCTTTKEGD